MSESHSVAKYMAALIGLGVDPEDAEKNAKQYFLHGKADFPIKEITDIAERRVTSLFEAGNNPNDQLLINYIESLGGDQITMFTIASDVSAEINNLMKNGRNFISPSDLIQPNPLIKPRLTLYGAYLLSEMVGIDSNLGNGIEQTINLLSNGVSYSDSTQSLVEPIFEMSDIINANGGWRWFMPHVLTPLRRKIAKYFC